jgi:RNA polymerase sigma factor (sigma-70 family)
LRNSFLSANSQAIICSFGENIFDALKKLGAREQFAIIMRYGLSRQEPRTYKDIADALGVSIAMVQNIERSGLNKLMNLGIELTVTRIIGRVTKWTSQSRPASISSDI